MDVNQFFKVRDGIQYDMHLHGSRFIVTEFALATLLEVVLLLLSINYALRLVDWPWWYAPWLVICAGLIPNSVTVWFVARKIAQKEGAHPALPSGPHTQRAIWALPLLVTIPLALPLLAWHQRNQ
jgi:hypothetical protein